MERIGYFDCYSGASGDMILGSLLDKAVDFKWFKNELQKLNLTQEHFNIEKTYVNRNNINTCKINITIDEHHKEDNHDHDHDHDHHHHHRSYNTICNIIDNSEIDIKAKELAKKIFYKLGTAEASIHNVPLEKIHFHEVGALDSIIDIVGFSICYTKLGIERTIVSPIPMGSGKVVCEHGCMPVPAPATLEILKDHNIKLIKNDYIQEECLTPTAAAILCTVVSDCSDFPSIDNIISIGYGAGTKIFDGNVTSNLRFVMGESNPKIETQELFCLEVFLKTELNSEILEKIHSLNIEKCLPSKGCDDKHDIQILYLVCNKNNLMSIIAILKEFNQVELLKYSPCISN